MKKSVLVCLCLLLPLTLCAQTTDKELLDSAEQCMRNGHEAEAVNLYEQVLAHDANNLQANIFLGNYHFLKAHDKKARLDADYRKIVEPTCMQRARHREELGYLFSHGYAKAREHLKRVLAVFPSTEAEITMEKINRLEAEMTGGASE